MAKDWYELSRKEKKEAAKNTLKSLGLKKRIK